MKTAICIANGSSLTADDVEYCRGKGTVYAIKEAMFLAPWADCLYAADGDWWDTYKGCPDFKGEKITVAVREAEKYGLTLYQYDPKLVWGLDNIIATGGNSGFQTVNIATLRGAERVILLGFDMGHKANKHWWTGKYKRDVRPSNYKDWIEKFKKASSIIPAKVINCTRETALDCFERADLRGVL